MTLRLFVADDSVTIQKIVSLAFSGEDVVIEAVSDGNSALERVRPFNPDVVLADVFMPGCSGYEVCSRIKEDPELRGVPVILLVGTFEPYDELEAARVRSDGYLTKPFDTSELIRTVHDLAGKKQRTDGTATAPRPAGASKFRMSYSGSRGLTTRAAWESFLGESRVLDLFDPETLAEVGPDSAADALLKPEMQLPEDAIDRIVEMVVRKMSSEVIREVAWEVVPELSEAIIRRILQERK